MAAEVERWIDEARQGDREALGRLLDHCRYRQIGRFHILRPLGHGGGGIVVLALDPDLRREVALKVPHLPALLEPEMARRFLREARAAAKLDHPNLVPVYEANTANGVCFLVSAYCRGGSLAQWLAAQTKPVSIRQTAEWLVALADAVQYVHANGIYHRDIKPGNILLDPRNEPLSDEPEFVPRLTDFGLAKLQDAQTEFTRSGAVLGTVSYMAPEQVEGRVRDIGLTTDVYGLGAVLYEMLTGRPPFRGATDTDTLRQVLQEEPTPPRSLRGDVPPDLQTICLRCLEKEPVRRYASAAELADDLRRFLADEPIQARRLGSIERLRKWVRRHPAKAVLTASGLLLMMVLAIGWLHLESLERARDADRMASAKQDEQRQQAIRENEQRLRQHGYADDIGQAWRSWENRRLDHMAGPLGKYRSPAGQDHEEELRGFEWYLLSRLARARPRLMHYPADLACVAFSPDGATCASGHVDGVIALWNPASGRQRALLKGQKGSIYALAYSPDGKYLVSGSGRSENGTVLGELLLWDMQTQKVLNSFPESLGGINSLAISPDGRLLASVADCGGSIHEVKLWTMPSGKLRHTLPFPLPRGAASAAFFADSRTIAIGHVDGKMSFYDSVTGQFLETRSGHQDRVWCAACGHKDAVVVSSGPDGSVRLWSLQPSAPLLAQYRHEEDVWSVALSPDDRSVASISHEMLKVWDRANHCEQFSCVLDGAGRIGRVVAFSPDGKTLAVGCQHGDLLLYDYETLRAAESLSWLGHRDGEKPCEIWAVAFSPDGKILASAGDDHTIRLWDPTTGHALAVLRSHQSLVTSLTFSSDGKTLASAGFDKKVKLWQVSTGRELLTLAEQKDRVRWLAFSPDSTMLATAAHDGILTIYRADKNEPRPRER